MRPADGPGSWPRAIRPRSRRCRPSRSPLSPSWRPVRSRARPVLRALAGRSGAIRPSGRASRFFPPKGAETRARESVAATSGVSGRARLFASAFRAGSRSRRSSLDDLVEPLALDQLHGVEGDVTIPTDLEDRHDVGVVQPRRRLRLAAEPLQGLAVARPRDRAGSSRPRGGPARSARPRRPPPCRPGRPRARSDSRRPG